MFNTRHNAPVFASRRRVQALQTWREAPGLVGIRRRAFLDADPASRSWVYASSVAALDAEEAPASEGAALSPSAIAA